MELGPEDSISQVGSVARSVVRSLERSAGRSCVERRLVELRS